MSYQVGSFRGAKFLTEKASTRVGRRQAIYELPFDDKGVAHFDLGRAARRYKIHAILLTSQNGSIDYAKARDALMKAFETKGAGLLVHPYLGRVMVVVQDDIEIVESTEHGGCAEVTFEAREARDPLPAASGVSGLLDAVNKLKNAASSSFLARLDPNGSDFVAAGLISHLDSVITNLRKVNASISSALAAPSALSDRLDAISIELAELVQTPRRLFDALDGFVGSLISSAGRVFNAVLDQDVNAIQGASAMNRAARRLADSGITAVFIPQYDTPPRAQQRQNVAVVTQTLHAITIANTAQALAENPPASRNEAQAISASMAELILDLADGSVEGVETPAELYDALKDVAATLQQFLEEVGGKEASTRIYKTADAIPIEVLAYRLYGDAERATEIRLRNPHIVGGVIPGQTELEVLER
jgi:prophage DNA circulation protein